MGKRRYLNLIGALDVPTDGEIIVDGKNIREYRQYHRFRAEMVGFVFQLLSSYPDINSPGKCGNSNVFLVSLAEGKKGQGKGASL